MKLKIINSTGIGRKTKIYVYDGDKEVGLLTCVERIKFD